MSERAREADMRAATAAIADRQSLLEGGVPLASGAGKHPTARKYNKINRTIERIEIAGD
jgi:hypothetical protein